MTALERTVNMKSHSCEHTVCTMYVSAHACMAATWITLWCLRHMFDMLACRENSSVSTSDPMARYLEPTLNTVSDPTSPSAAKSGIRSPVLLCCRFILSQFVLCKASLTSNGVIDPFTYTCSYVCWPR